MVSDKSAVESQRAAKPASTRRVLAVDARDNVANALEALDSGDHFEVLGRVMAVRTPVPMGHKVALAPIAAGDAVVKYGQAIGRASADIAAGEHVHAHNVASLFDDWLSAHESLAGRR
ncbi:MAG: UxaA family hydrolase [Burkholderiaceae bacterium]|nr:UxaA family hydrolase [Burkholderiaceae bacterium]